MSFRSLPEKAQRELARESLSDAEGIYHDNPDLDMSHLYGPRGITEDEMIEWLKSQDDVDPHSVMEGLAKKSSLKTQTPLLDGIRKSASSDQLKNVEKRLGIYLQDPEARDYAIDLRNKGLSSKKVMRELLRKFPDVAKGQAEALEGKHLRKAEEYAAETARKKATQPERTAKAISSGLVRAIGTHHLTKPSKQYSSYSSGPDGYTRESYRRW